MPSLSKRWGYQRSLVISNVGLNRTMARWNDGWMMMMCKGLLGPMPVREMLALVEKVQWVSGARMNVLTCQ